jgi:glycosyltransferase involved in cell wall biosynthesis
MIVVLIVFFCVYLLSIGVIIGVGFIRQRGKEINYGMQQSKVSPSEITVLVPFRNEEHRIVPLLNCINELTVQPHSFIFINDHSNDASVKVIEDHLKVENYTIVHTPKGQAGKKLALRYGAKSITTSYTLTIDADVEFHNEFFEALGTLGEADMYVLPAIMEAETFLERLYEVDLVLVTAANAGLAGLKRPIMASGANLLYKTNTFDRVDNIESHGHMASGDDTYLLRDFRESKTDVRLHTDRSCAITTETPQSFKEFINQRLRWIGKTGDIKDNLSTSLAVIQAVLTVTFFGVLIWTLVLQDWKLFLYLIGLKSLFDLLLFLPYFARIKRIGTWLFIPIYEVLFPIYTLLIVVLMLFYKPKWKGRAIYSKD